jgi:hypothetical protein
MTTQQIDALKLGTATRNVSGPAPRGEWYNIIGMAWPFTARIRGVPVDQFEFSVYQRMVDIAQMQTKHSSPEAALDALKAFLKTHFLQNG